MSALLRSFRPRFPSSGDCGARHGLPAPPCHNLAAGATRRHSRFAGLPKLHHSHRASEVKHLEAMGATAALSTWQGGRWGHGWRCLALQWGAWRRMRGVGCRSAQPLQPGRANRWCGLPHASAASWACLSTMRPARQQCCTCCVRCPAPSHSPHARSPPHRPPPTHTRTQLLPA